MKKVRVMLSAIAVLAVVGGALAFKAKTSAFGTTIYTGTIENQCSAQLTNHSVQSTPVTLGQASVFYTVSGDQPDCTAKAYTVGVQ